MASELTREHVVYYVRRPATTAGNGKRATFAIYRKVTAPDGTVVSQSPVEDDTVQAINAAMKGGTLPQAEASLQVEARRDYLNEEARKHREGGYVANDANRKLLAEYWERAYTRRKLRAPEAAKYKLAQAIDTLGPLSLLGDVDAIQKAVDSAFKSNPNRQRAIAASLNQMRKFFGLTKDRIALERRRKGEVPHLTEAEFLKVLPFVGGYENKKLGREVGAEVLRDLFAALFYSGARLSEGFAFQRSRLNIEKRSLFIATQLDSEFEEVPTKSNNERRALFFPQGKAAFDRWVDFPNKEWIDRRALPRIFTRACKAAFPKNPRKWVVVHDLRHSYAITLARDFDYGLTRISQFLGNSVAVCEYYYAQFVVDDDTIHLQFKAKLAARVNSD